MRVRSHVLPPRRSLRRVVVLCSLPAVVATLVTCTDGVTPTAPAEPTRPAAEIAGGASSLAALSTIPLPIFQGVTSSGTAFGIVQNGLGGDGLFLINNPTNKNSALRASTTGMGRAAEFRISNTGSWEPAVYATTNGRSSAGSFLITNANNINSALYARTSGEGSAGVFLVENPSSLEGAIVSQTRGKGSAGEFYIYNPGNQASALQAGTDGIGNALRVSLFSGSCTSTPTACNFAVFTSNGNQIRFGRLGRGYFNGGTQTGGADVAEAFQVEGRPRDYEPGDVLVISTRSDQRVERSQAPYSTLVAGVYATKPGVLLTERHIDANLDDTVPLGVVGVIPTKVSAENGPIRRGDLLVTARTPGHAMRGDPERLRIGTSLGKALEGWVGTDPGAGERQVASGGPRGDPRSRESDERPAPDRNSG
jgi:hypothetical protein